MLKSIKCSVYSVVYYQQQQIEQFRLCLLVVTVATVSGGSGRRESGNMALPCYICSKVGAEVGNR